MGATTMKGYKVLKNARFWLDVKGKPYKLEVRDDDLMGYWDIA